MADVSEPQVAQEPVVPEAVADEVMADVAEPQVAQLPGTTETSAEMTIAEVSESDSFEKTEDLELTENISQKSEKESLVESALADMLSSNQSDEKPDLSTKDEAVNDVLSDMLSEDVNNDKQPSEEKSDETVAENDHLDEDQIQELNSEENSADQDESDNLVKTDFSEDIAASVDNPEVRNELNPQNVFDAQETQIDKEPDIAVQEEILSDVTDNESVSSEVQTDSSVDTDDVVETESELSVSEENTETVRSSDSSFAEAKDESVMPEEAVIVDVESEEQNENKSLAPKQIDVAEIEDALRKGQNIDEMLNDDLDLESLLFRQQNEDQQEEESSEESSDRESSNDSIYDEEPHNLDGVDNPAILQENVDNQGSIESQEEIEQSSDNSIDEIEAPEENVEAAEELEQQKRAEDITPEVDSVTIDDEQHDDPSEDQSLSSAEQQNEDVSSDEISTIESVDDSSGDSLEIDAEDPASHGESADDHSESAEDLEQLNASAEEENNGTTDNTTFTPLNESPSEQSQIDESVVAVEEQQDEDLSQNDISEPLNWKIPEQDGYDLTGGEGLEDDLVNPSENIESESGEGFIVQDSFVDIDDSKTSTNSSGYTDNAILNMLHHGPADNTIKTESSSSGDLSDDDLISMLNDSPSDNDPDNGDLASENSPELSADDEHTESGDLTPKQHQYLVDELNLARLYFETGDTDEALKMVEEIINQGSDDLVVKAHELRTEYGY